MRGKDGSESRILKDGLSLRGHLSLLFMTVGGEVAKGEREKGREKKTKERSHTHTLANRQTGRQTGMETDRGA